ncbi:hypothetical protein AX16_001814 [Volvariella volvacea WC 439]|nr:hypothetical protein AX16_001814 [Volvariella volvacea WC 439]
MTQDTLVDLGKDLDVLVPLNIFIRNACSLLLFTCIVWEYVMSFGTELQLIWRRPITLVKGIYVYSRYFALFHQLINQVLIVAPLSRYPIPDMVCRRWFTYQITGAQSLLWPLECLLMLRVYALYCKQRIIGRALVVLFAVQLLIVLVALPTTINTAHFDEFCAAAFIPTSAALYCASEFVFQSTLWLLTIMRHRIAQRDGWADAPVLWRVSRDGAWVCLAVIGSCPQLPLTGGMLIHVTPIAMLLFILPYSYFSRGAAQVIFSLPTTSLSITV